MVFRGKGLNKREASYTTEKVNAVFGCDCSYLADEYTFFQSEKSKIYLISNDIKSISFDNLHINSLGLYFAETGDERLRLSIEGSQIIGKIATKNIFEVDDETAKKWMKGQDIPCETEFEGFVIIKCKDDFLGCGRYRQKMLLNYIPKARRIKGD